MVMVIARCHISTGRHLSIQVGPLSSPASANPQTRVLYHLSAGAGIAVTRILSAKRCLLLRPDIWSIYLSIALQKAWTAYCSSGVLEAAMSSTAVLFFGSRKYLHLHLPTSPPLLHFVSANELGRRL
jgi:hypothetical protein